MSRINPFFYLIDGFRCGFFGVSDVSPWESLVVVSLAVIGVSALALHLLKTGYKFVIDCLFGLFFRKSQMADPHPPKFGSTSPTVCFVPTWWWRAMASTFATIVSAEFDGKSRVARHQRVYQAPGR